MSMEPLVSALRAAGEPTRLRLLGVLAEGELTVSELTQVLAQSQPRISRHLKLLVEAGLLERKPEGSWVFYRLAGQNASAGGGPLVAETLARMIAGLIRRDEAVFQRDLERLELVKAERAAEAQAYFNAIAEGWGRIRSLHASEAQVEAAVLDLAGRGPFKHCVDLGTGTGRMLELLAPHIARGDGIDLSHEMLKIARTKLDRARLTHCQVRHGDIFSLPYPNGQASLIGPGSGIDLVIIHQVLHYLAEPEAALAEAARILGPGGKILIVDFAPHEFEILRTEHQHRRLGLSEEDVQRWCRSAGLVVEEMRHIDPPASEDMPHLTVTIWRAAAPSRATQESRLETAGR